MLTKAELPECPVATTVQLIGNKWKLLIIRNLLTAPQRFTELKKTIPGISQKVLADNLRSLENDGLVDREAFAEVPPRALQIIRSPRRLLALRTRQNLKTDPRRDDGLGNGVQKQIIIGSVCHGLLKKDAMFQTSHLFYRKQPINAAPL